MSKKPSVPSSTSSLSITRGNSTQSRQSKVSASITSNATVSNNERSNEVPPSTSTPSSNKTAQITSTSTANSNTALASTSSSTATLVTLLSGDDGSNSSTPNFDDSTRTGAGDTNSSIPTPNPTQPINPTSSTSSAALPISTTNIKKEKSQADSYFQRIKKRPISGVINSDADSELTCPICFDLIDVAHVTKCGHSFCQNCIQTALEHTHRCPKCNTPCSIVKDVFPNFTLNQIIERYKEEANSKKCKLTQNVSDSNKTTSHIIEYINSAQDDLNIEDVNQLISVLAQRKEELKFTNKKVNELLLYDFLKHLQQSKTEELNKIQHELQMVNENCKQVEETLEALKAKPDLLIKSETIRPTSILNSPSTSKQASTNAASTSTSSLLPSPEDIETQQSICETAADPTSNQESCSVKIQSILSSKKRIIHRYFDELSHTYVQSHNTDLKDFNLRDCTTKGSQSIVLDQIRETVSKITTYSEFKSIASVNYNHDLYSMSSIVSSVDFDKSYEHFAIAGVTKRIKIFDFNNILYRPYGMHYPLYEMVHNAKLSCVSWNRYFRQQLACSDYEGVVTLWDAEAGTLMRSYQEHEKRCWGVQFCDVDPRLLASASDDSKVKIWSTNSEYSLLSIDAKSNVCCVVFKPDSKFHVLFGTADHSIHYYDLRNPKEAVSLFKGHKKAVSYVKFSGENEFVSASTDSNLKMWKLNEGQCIRSFTGHVNEKNFVGLETHNGYIVTGSENNTVYLYCNELSKPLLTYKFDDGVANKKDEGMNDFVSAVCWSNQNYLLAANSQGIVKVLELI